jgi:uncharacterized membrane protein YeaQ/YmgE (transglycosylase-associated protein family)
MGIFGWIILGLAAGLIAKALLPGKQPGGVLLTAVIGVVGALAAGFIARSAGWGDPIDEFFDASTWAAAIIGAAVLLVIWGAVSNGNMGKGRWR